MSPEKPQAGTDNPLPDREPTREPGGSRPKQVAAARRAAARTARASSPQEKDNARAWTFAQLRDNRPVEWRALSARFHRGETWCRARIREAEDAYARITDAAAHASSADRPERHLVPVGEPTGTPQ